MAIVIPHYKPVRLRGRNYTPTTAAIGLGDITSARFLTTEDWTVLSFFRVESTDGDDRCIISKQAVAGGGTRQFLFRTDLQDPAPTYLEIYNSTGIGWNGPATGADVITLNTWYLGVVRHPVSRSRLEMFSWDVKSGNQIDNNVQLNDSSDASDLTADIQIGLSGASDPMDGDIAFTSYFSRLLSVDDMVQYLRDPLSVLDKYRTSCEFFIPGGEVYGTQVADISGKGNHGTISGTTAVIQPPPGLRHYSPLAIPEAAAGGGFFLPSKKSYRTPQPWSWTPSRVDV